LPDDIHDYSRFADEGHDKVRIFGEKKKPEDVASDAFQKAKADKKPDAPGKPGSGEKSDLEVPTLEQPKVSGTTEPAAKDDGGKRSDDVRVEKPEENKKSRRRLEKTGVSDKK